jgi:phosphate transport system substrate-binding protein
MLPPPTVQVIEGMDELVERVAEYRDHAASIGYTYKYYIDTLYKNDNIKVLQIDGIIAEEKNLRSGSYPFTTVYYGVIREEDENSWAGKFLDWMLTDDGQRSIKQAGYIPSTDL